MTREEMIDEAVRQNIWIIEFYPMWAGRGAYPGPIRHAVWTAAMICNIRAEFHRLSGQLFYVSVDDWRRLYSHVSLAPATASA